MCLLGHRRRYINGCHLAKLYYTTRSPHLSQAIEISSFSMATISVTLLVAAPQAAQTSGFVQVVPMQSTVVQCVPVQSTFAQFLCNTLLRKELLYNVLLHKAPSCSLLLRKAPQCSMSTPLLKRPLVNHRSRLIRLSAKSINCPLFSLSLSRHKRIERPAHTPPLT